MVSSNSCLIYGDFNLPGIDWLAGSGHTRIEKYFYSFTQKEALVQLVDFNNRKSNFLDLILTNNIFIVSSISPINPIKYDKHVSDHISIYSCILHPYSSSNTSNHYFRSSASYNFRKAEFITIKSELMSTDWDAFLNNSIDGLVMLNNFYNLLIKICNNYSPLYSHKKYKFHIHIKILLNKCRHLHKNINNSISYVKWRICQ